MVKQSGVGGGLNWRRPAGQGAPPKYGGVSHRLWNESANKKRKVRASPELHPPGLRPFSEVAACRAAAYLLASYNSGKEPNCQCRRHKRRGFSPWVGKIPWRRTWQPTPGFLPGESHGQRSLVGYSPWGHTESDTTEHTHTTLRSSAFQSLACETHKENQSPKLEC